MEKVTVSDATEVYARARNCTVRRERIWHAGFYHFCTMLRQLEKSLGSSAENEYWRSFLWVLRRYRFLLSSVPIPFNHPIVQNHGTASRLRQQLVLCPQLYPGMSDMASDVLEAYLTVCGDSSNPALDTILHLGILTSSKRTALVLRESRMIAPVASILAQTPGMRKVEVLSSQELRKYRTYDVIVIPSPGKWLPEYVLSAPRSSLIQIVHYAWIRDAWKLEPVLQGSVMAEGEAVSEAHNVSSVFAADPVLNLQEADWVDSEELLPHTDWAAISAAVSGASSEVLDQDSIDALLLLLENNRAVFLDAEEGSTGLVIDLDESPESRVRRIPVRSICPGMFILLRTVGGGDYIVTVANRMLGKLAQPARERQEFWKSRLREKIRSKGLFAVALDLIDVGSTIANEVNVRNWSLNRNIRTRDYHDFLAIMRYIGMESQAAEYWETMGLIDSAHRKAGSFIRRRLLRQILTADLTKLERQGTMDFELAESDGGSLTAFRVTSVSPETFTVSASQLMHVTELEEELWRG